MRVPQTVGEGFSTRGGLIQDLSGGWIETEQEAPPLGHRPHSYLVVNCTDALGFSYQVSMLTSSCLNVSKHY